MKHHRSLVPALLKFGFEVDLEDSLGDTPLGLAVKAGDLETVRLLVNARADVTETIYGHFLAFEAGASSDQGALVSGMRAILAEQIRRIGQRN